MPKETPGWGDGVLDYLKKVGATDAKDRKPFCLFISLVNPHDVCVHPTLWEKAGYKNDPHFSNYNDPGQLNNLLYSALTGVRSMNQTFPLEKVEEAYQLMLTGKARFRVVLLA